MGERGDNHWIGVPISHSGQLNTLNTMSFMIEAMGLS